MSTWHLLNDKVAVCPRIKASWFSTPFDPQNLCCLSWLNQPDAYIACSYGVWGIEALERKKKINKTVHCYKVRMIPKNNNSRSAAVKFYSEFINRLRIIYIFFIWWKYVIYSLSCVSLGAALTLCLVENQQGPLDYLQIRWFMLPRIPRLLSQFMRRTLAPVADGDWFGLVVYQSLIQSLHRRSKLSREGAKRIQSNLNNTDISLLWAVIFALNLKIDTISIEFLPL